MDSVSRQRGEGFVVVGQMVPQESNCEGLALGKIQDTIFFSCQTNGLSHQFSSAILLNSFLQYRHVFEQMDNTSMISVISFSRSTSR